MSDRGEKGRFAKGNKLGKANKKVGLQELKLLTKSEIIKCAHTLTLPLSTLKDGLLNSDPSRLEYLTAKAIQNNNHKWLQWLVEMSIGRPKEYFDVNDNIAKEDKLAGISTGELTSFIKKVAADGG